MIEPQKDFMFWIAVLLSVVAVFVWSVSATLNIGDPWVTLVAVVVVAGALGSVVVSAGRKNKGVVWTEEMKLAYKRRAMQQARKSVLSLVWLIGILVVVQLVRVGVLPQWAGAFFLIVLMAGWLWYWFFARRSTT